MRLRRIKVVPLADESLGVRSMALFVETPDVRILFDAGVSLAPRRYGLPPHPEEFRAVKEARRRIIEYARRADIVTVSHYHFDHYTPGFKSWYEWTEDDTIREIYDGKVVLLKDFKNNINFNQSKRARAFLKALEGVCEEVVVVDGRRYEVSETVIEASPPLPHGPEGSKLGFVLAFTVRCRGESLLYAPDVQGPMAEEALRVIASVEPNVLIIGGPPAYLAGKKVKREDVERGLRNLAEASKLAEEVVVTHHILRSEDWRSLIEEAGVAKYYTYNQLLGVEYTGLEAYRKLLYEVDPPSQEFLSWIERYRKGVKDEPPPL